MFVVNSRLGFSSVAGSSSMSKSLHQLRPSFSRSYGVNMPSSLTIVLPLALVYSTRLPVSVLVRAHFTSLEAFLGSVVRLNLFTPRGSLSIGSRPSVWGFASTQAYRLRRTFPIVRSSSLLRHSILKRFHAVQEFLPVVHRLCLLPRLRSRLTLGRRALPRIP